MPMDVTAVDQMEFHFQQVLEHFGKVKIYLPVHQIQTLTKIY